MEGLDPILNVMKINHKKKRLIRQKKKEDQFLNMALKFIKDLNPEYFLPFAGTYTLTGKLSKLQHLRGVPSIDKAYKFLEGKNEVLPMCPIVPVLATLPSEKV